MEDWRDFFTARELREIDFAILYATEFAHGTDGHNAKIIIAKFATLIEEAARQLEIARIEVK